MRDVALSALVPTTQRGHRTHAALVCLRHPVQHCAKRCCGGSPARSKPIPHHGVSPAQHAPRRIARYHRACRHMMCRNAAPRGFRVDFAAVASGLPTSAQRPQLAFRAVPYEGQEVDNSRPHRVPEVPLRAFESSAFLQTRPASWRVCAGLSLFASSAMSVAMNCPCHHAMCVNQHATPSRPVPCRPAHI